MFLVAGLGNPGRKYEHNRHNVGFMVVEELARRAGSSLSTGRFDGRFARVTLAGESVGLLCPETYMNLSGEAVGAAARFFKVEPEDVIAVHDELDLPFGTVRLKSGGGLAGHKGLKSIRQHLGTADFLRVRVGIGRPEGPMDVSGYVLSDFGPEDSRELESALGTAADAIECLLREGIRPAMNRFHRREE